MYFHHAPNQKLRWHPNLPNYETNHSFCKQNLKSWSNKAQILITSRICVLSWQQCRNALPQSFSGCFHSDTHKLQLSVNLDSDEEWSSAHLGYDRLPTFGYKYPNHTCIFCLVAELRVKREFRLQFKHKERWCPFFSHAVSTLWTTCLYRIFFKTEQETADAHSAFTSSLSFLAPIITFHLKVWNSKKAIFVTIHS